MKSEPFEYVSGGADARIAVSTDVEVSARSVENCPLYEWTRVPQSVNRVPR
jgi:hypothetical protein